jgi:hypothetical protein
LCKGHGAQTHPATVFLRRPRQNRTCALFERPSGSRPPPSSREHSPGVIQYSRIPQTVGTWSEEYADPNRVNHVLVIPVVTVGQPFNPLNNLVASRDPALPARIKQQFDDAARFWREASYGKTTFTTVLDRYFQLPRHLEDYYDPGFRLPTLSGASFLTPGMIAVPAGKIKAACRLGSFPGVLRELGAATRSLVSHRRGRTRH